LQAAVKLGPSVQAYVLSTLAEAYGESSKADESVKVLAQAQQAANAMSSKDKSLVLVKVATLYAKISRWREALGAAQLIGSEVDAVSALSRILIIWKDTKNSTKNMDALEELFQGIDKEPPFR